MFAWEPVALHVEDVDQDGAGCVELKDWAPDGRREIAMSAVDVDTYLAQLDEPKRSTLEHVRGSIARAIPEAEQGLSYGVPVFRISGTPVAGFSAAKRWLSYLPHSGDILSTMSEDDLEGLSATKGALRFPIDEPLPDSLVHKLIDARRAEAGV